MHCINQPEATKDGQIKFVVFFDIELLAYQSLLDQSNEDSRTESLPLGIMHALQWGDQVSSSRRKGDITSTIVTGEVLVTHVNKHVTTKTGHDHIVVDLEK